MQVMMDKQIPALECFNDALIERLVATGYVGWEVADSDVRVVVFNVVSREIVPQ